MRVVPAAATTAAPWQRSFPGWDRSSSPTLADVNGDGVPDAVFGSQAGFVDVVDGRTGHNLPGWPQATGVAIDSSPAVADLDGDGHPEIIVGAGSTWAPSQTGGVFVFNSSGARRCRFTTPVASGGPSWTAVFSSPAIGDIDGDGHPDIVFGGFDLRVHAIDRNCNELPGFPFYQDDTTFSSPALYDIDGDGRMEIFIGGDSSPGGPTDHQGGVFRALDWRNGQVVELWHQFTNDVISSSPAIADINGDGHVDVVVGGGDYWHGSDGHRVFAWDARNGALLRGWPQTLGGVVFGSPAIGDLEGNGAHDVVVGARNGAVYALRGNGSLLWARVLHRQSGIHGDNSVGPINGSPAVADLNGDGHEDVAISNDWGTYLINGRNGLDLTTRYNSATPVLAYWSFETAPAIADVAGVRRLYTIGFSTGGGNTEFASYPLAPAGGKASWPMFRKNARHLAAPASGGPPLPAGYCSRPVNPKSVSSSRSAGGYWFLGSDGGVFSFGAARFHGSLPALGIHTNTIGLTPTRSGNGYWVLAGDGGVFSFGDARFYGSMGGRALRAPVIRMARSASGRGYYLLASDGGVFSFGDAKFYGSTGNRHLNAPVISMAVTPTGHGYWLLASDGGVFSFGDAKFYGSTGAMRLNAPVISMAVRPQGNGYWLLGGDGGVFSFGAARFHGSVPGTGLCAAAPAVQLRSTLTGNGYWLLGRDGGVFSFGDAKFYGSQPGLSGSRAAVDMAIKS
jgi:FG-GAP-like repeat